MTERFYCDAVGKYIGAFIDSAPPEGSLEVPFPPPDASRFWNGTQWIERALSVDEQIAALDAAYAVKMAKLNNQYVEAAFANGSGETARLAELRVQRQQAFDQYTDDFLTIIMGA